MNERITLPDGKAYMVIKRCRNERQARTLAHAKGLSWTKHQGSYLVVQADPMGTGIHSQKQTTG
jgi:hypothetical protein